MAFFISPTPALFPSEAAPPISRTRENELGWESKTHSIRYNTLQHILGGWERPHTSRGPFLRPALNIGSGFVKETLRSLSWVQLGE